MKEMIKEGIISNSDVRIETDNELCIYKPSGQAIEVGLIKFLMDNEYDIQNVMINRNKLAAKIANLAFDQRLKRKVVVRYVHENPNAVRIYVKGAPEEVMKLCSFTLTKDVKPTRMSSDLRKSILSNIVDANMAADGQKVMSFAFKEVKLSDMQSLRQHHDEESRQFREWCEKDLIYLGTFGLHDPIRENVKDTINMIKYGNKEGAGADSSQANVRMVTGDHLSTAIDVALKTGIVRKDELNNPHVAMTGK